MRIHRPGDSQDFEKRDRMPRPEQNRVEILSKFGNCLFKEQERGRDAIEAVDRSIQEEQWEGDAGGEAEAD